VTGQFYCYSSYNYWDNRYSKLHAILRSSTATATLQDVKNHIMSEERSKADAAVRASLQRLQVGEVDTPLEAQWIPQLTRKFMTRHKQTARNLQRCSAVSKALRRTWSLPEGASLQLQQQQYSSGNSSAEAAESLVVARSASSVAGDASSVSSMADSVSSGASASIDRLMRHARDKSGAGVTNTAHSYHSTALMPGARHPGSAGWNAQLRSSAVSGDASSTSAAAAAVTAAAAAAAPVLSAWHKQLYELCADQPECTVPLVVRIRVCEAFLKDARRLHSIARQERQDASGTGSATGGGGGAGSRALKTPKHTIAHVQKLLQATTEEIQLLAAGEGARTAAVQEPLCVLSGAAKVRFRGEIELAVKQSVLARRTAAGHHITHSR
jgi:hypothetical protein